MPEGHEELMEKLRALVPKMVQCVQEAKDPRALDAKLIKQTTEMQFDAVVRSCLAVGIDPDKIRGELQPLVDIGYLKEKK
ncbi:MAG: hypothetical protein NTY30_00580 [Candidatus Berkelbacteria bacterium]|nr:hypothetical protein [Candidatus Berkelbacteria bacterium]